MPISTTKMTTRGKKSSRTPTRELVGDRMMMTVRAFVFSTANIAAPHSITQKETITPYFASWMYRVRLHVLVECLLVPLLFARKLTMLWADEIVDTRLHIIKPLLEPVVSLLRRPVVCTKVVDRFLDMDYSVVYTSLRHGEQTLWLYNKPTVTPKILGDLLREEELFPLPEPHEYKGSVLQLYAQLKGLRSIFGEYFMRADSDDDWTDMDDVMQELDVVFRSRPSVPLSRSEKERLQRHRQKCGLQVD
jgi:hypothetical protein